MPRNKPDPHWPTVEERDLLAYAYKMDAVKFIKVALGVDNPKNPKAGWWDETIHTPLVRWAEKQTREWLADRDAGKRERRYCAVIVPRLVGKSTLITTGLALWSHLWDPNLSTYIGNETRPMAQNFLSAIKSWMSGKDRFSLFSWLYGNWEQRSETWRSDSLVHGARNQPRREPSFGIFSINSGLTGRHPDALFVDDFVSYEGLESDVDLFDKAWSMLSSLTPVVESNGIIWLIGTRYGDGDPHGRAFSQDGIKTLAGMADEPDYQPRENGVWNVYYLSGRHTDGTPAIPSIWSEKEMQIWAKRDPVKYAFQVLCRPKASSLRVLQDKEFDQNVQQVAPPRRLTVNLHLDTAFKHQKRQTANNDNVIVAMGHEYDQTGIVWFLGAWYSQHWKSHDMAMNILAAHRWCESYGWKVFGITDEQEPGGKLGTWESLLQNYYGQVKMQMPMFHYIQRSVQAKSKDTRIVDALGFLRAKKVKVWKDAPGLDAFRYQAIAFPNVHNRDILDAFSDCFTKELYSALVWWQRNADPERDLPGWEAELKPQYVILNGKEEFDREPIR